MGVAGTNEKTIDSIAGRVEDARTANSAGSVCAEQIVSTKANLHQIWRETMNKLSSFSHRVSENRDVMAASEFARWVSFSGLIPFFKQNPQPEPFKVDGSILEWTVDHLIERCNDRFRTNNSDPKLSVDEFESLHDKVDKLASNLDTVAGYLARMSVAPAVKVESLPREEVELTVISGGLDKP